MGSTTPPDQQTNHSDVTSELTVCELMQLLEQRNQEILLLKFELQKYKLALRQSQTGCQEQLKPQAPSDRIEASETANESLLDSASNAAFEIEQIVSKRHIAPVVEEIVGGETKSNTSLSKETTSHSTVRRQSTTARQSFESGSSIGSLHTRGRVIFKTGHEDDDEDDDEDDGQEVGGKGTVIDERSEMEKEDEQHRSIVEDITADDEEDLEDIIQDIGEITFDSELDSGENRTPKKSDKHSPRGRESGLSNNIDNDKGGKPVENEAFISDGLLTSLTDAAISNLSQLAALQERCESQQRSHHQDDDHRPAPSGRSHSQVSSTEIFVDQTALPGAIAVDRPSATSLTSVPSAIASSQSTVILGENHRYGLQDPFSPSNIANQAALAISAASSMQTPPDLALSHSSSSSTSQNSTIQPDLSTSHTLANVVAAAAAAAAAANDQQQYHDSTHQISSTEPTRLISSALSSPEYYHNLQQHQRTHQATSSQHTTISPLAHHYSPSPSSLIGHSRARPGSSNASSSFMSPLASPNYLRRQFMPDKLPLMSPSPSSMTTGSSSAASTSLAHILQQHQQSYQQRSVSALAGPITSPSSTPISSTGSTAVSPLIGSKNSSQVRLNNMQIRHKFGYLGSGRGQFNSPHGFCLGLNQEIVVADTNNHRVCIFDKSGTYITQFGSPGKEEGQLWNPRKVAILHRPLSGGSTSVAPSTSSEVAAAAHHRHHQQQLSTYSSQFTSARGIQNTSSVGGSSQFASDPLYVVCDRGAERSRMQLFTKDGVFIKKIGIHYIDIVAGLAITQNGLIIVVDSVSPTVYIINAETGTLNGWFDCSGHMKEPSDIAVKSDLPGNEYFICDFKGHCVVVFSEQGEYLRKIGHDGLTSYPNGIDISDDGDILVGDSHGNRFHVVVFDRNGNFVSQFECPHVKVSRCCGLKITREGYIVTLAKNNHHVLVLDTIHI